MPSTRNPYALPVHQQISEMLIREIAAGRIIEGEKLPPERDMAAGLGIAVGTLRKALGDLERKGLLSRVQGSGNYVRALARRGQRLLHVPAGAGRGRRAADGACPVGRSAGEAG